ncbi:MAG: 3-hydroxyacyl-ACP dehydratase FabZ [Gammaproteobacteria bacterium]|nr:3-hydroxyacyl-ACP dehydratase FabZ [Gammaproteobacteria bacterium]
MSIGEILSQLPHRYPFVLIDRVLECVPAERLVALKNVTFNEPFFPGHFPDKPVMPAVLILEAMAQATGLLAMKSFETTTTDASIYYFVGIDKARFRRPVVPGDQLIIEVLYQRHTKGILRASAQVKVEGKLVASAELMGALRDLES